MIESTINGYQIHDYIVSGAKQIIKNEKQLNDINVFPVADGDTGSNLAYTMQSIINNSERNNSVQVTLASISEAAIDASYGNSGTIIARYFYGLSQSAKNKNFLTVTEFIQILQEAVRYAYESISTPKEGTILTVMREWTAYLKNELDRHNSFENLIHSSLEHAYEILDKTKTLLSVLAEADVVDAGAKGFVCFIEGVYDFIKTGKVSDRNFSRIEKINHDKISHSIHDLKYKYCTEITIENNHPDIKKIEEIVKSYGDSAIVSSHKSQIKIHVHTDNPHQLTYELSGFGNILYSKVDNMKIQQDIVHNRKYKIALVTDTIADLPDDYIEENQISLIPLVLIHNGSIYLDKFTTNSQTVFSTLNKSSEYPRSSQPNELFIEKTLRFLLEHYDRVIGITISSKMSGTFEKMAHVAEKLNKSEKRIEIIDSSLNSGAEGLLVKNTMDMIRQGQSFEKILEGIKTLKKKIDIFVKIPDLTYAARSGRFPMVAGKIATYIGIKPIISIDPEGTGIVLKELNLQKLITRRSKENKIIEYVIVHTDNIVKAKELADFSERVIGFPPLYIEAVSSIISAYMGKGAYGIAFREE